MARSLQIMHRTGEQGLAALPSAAIYALLAGAYALLYGLNGRIVLAFGEFAALGALASVIGVALVMSLPAATPVSGLFVAFAVGIAVAAAWGHPVALAATAILVGAGVGAATPVAFSYLAASTPPERMGRTMGSAELGRELGDAGGPLVAGAVGTATVPGLGLSVVAALTAGAGALAAIGLRRGAGVDAPEDR